jgi:anti-sigma factor RsiW
MTTSCSSIGEYLGAYVDGELGAAERMAVSQHLLACPSCADELQDMRQVGDALRVGAATLPTHDVRLQGLASGIISRTRAEDAQSWRAMLGRASEDWHWAFVGAGSLVAAVASILLVSAICGLGPMPDREDSLAAMLTNLQTPAGTLLIMVAPAGPDQAPMLLQFDNGEAGGRAEPAVVPAGFSSPSGSDLALALSQAVVGPDGRMSDLRSMSQPLRQHTETLLDDIQRLSVAPPASWSGRPVSILKLGFVTNTSVSGKAL